MSQNSVDEECLLFKVHQCDEPVLVAADVEDERAGSSRVIGGRESLLDLREMLPTGGPRKGQESGNPCEIQPRRPLLDNAANTFSHRHTHDRPLLHFNSIGMCKLLIWGATATTKTT